MEMKEIEKDKIIFNLKDMKKSFDAGFDRGFEEGQDQSTSNYREPLFEEWLEIFNTKENVIQVEKYEMFSNSEGNPTWQEISEYEIKTLDKKKLDYLMKVKMIRVAR